MYQTQRPVLGLESKSKERELFYVLIPKLVFLYKGTLYLNRIVKPIIFKLKQSQKLLNPKTNESCYGFFFFFEKLTGNLFLFAWVNQSNSLLLTQSKLISTFIDILSWGVHKKTYSLFFFCFPSGVSSFCQWPEKLHEALS